MPELLLHPKTKATVENLIAVPPQAILLVGKNGTGKQTVATYVAAQLLEIERSALGNHPYFTLQGTDEGAISIDVVRDIQHFLSRKTAASTAISRVAVIVNAERLTPEAQNAFLKTLEEPPAGSVLILTVSGKQNLLPTIASRVQSVDIATPDVAEVKAHFAATGFGVAAIDRAVLMSGGLPGLMSSILAGEQDHPLVKAADIARSILRLDTFGRLALIDSLTKQRQQCLDVCFIFQQMAELSLLGSTKTTAAYKQWQTVLISAYEAEQALRAQAQPKLVLSKLMLSL
jgi:hypothetical protein